MRKSVAEADLHYCKSPYSPEYRFETLVTIQFNLTVVW